MTPLSSPLVRWDDLHLVFDIPIIERMLRRRLVDVEALSAPDLDGRGDRLNLGLRVHWKGISMRVRVELREIRIRHRRLGFRVGRIKGPGGFPAPRIAVLRTLRAAAPELVTIIPGSDVVIIDLRSWIPPEVTVRVVAVQVVGEGLHIWMPSGSVVDIPHPGHHQLLGGEPEKSLLSGAQ